MGFTLKVIFTGLCAFVENENIADPTRMCVVLVNGTKPETQRNVLAIDDTPLRFHRAFVTFPINDIQPPIPEVNGLPMSHGIWYLNRERLHIEFGEEAGAMNDFDIRRPDLGDPHPEIHDGSPRQMDSFTWVADLSQVAPRHTLIADAAVASTGVSSSVIGQVLIKKGRLRPASFTRAVWEFDRHLSTKGHRRNFAHEVALTLGSLTNATLISTPLDAGGAKRTLSLTPSGGRGTVNIRISNLCDLNPLQWFTRREPSPDHDTKWFYEILSDATKTSLKTDLRGHNLPIPRPVQFLDNLGGPGSGNCIPLQTAKKPFTFPLELATGSKQDAKDRGRF